ncbi:MAG: PTS sugar transporter subunit IIA [Spirochaetales bacterium]|nr:PTS sugar transporter subunit IIA [Spirochaetales bacterium]
MNLLSLINPDCMEIDSTASDKTEVLKEIAALAKRNGILKNITEEAIFAKLAEREEIGSTGFENSVAIPHCSFDTINEFVTGILINKKGVDFKSIDGKKTKIFFFIIGPADQRNKHIKLLSSISRLIKKNIQTILNAGSKEDILRIIESNTKTEDTKIIEKEKVLFHIFIQTEKYFNDILQILSEVVEGSISVLSTYNAGYYLHKLPIYTSFWTDEKKKYSKIIIAVVDKTLANNVIRKINTTVETIEKESGILITANELFYSNGQIDF